MYKLFSIKFGILPHNCYLCNQKFVWKQLTLYLTVTK